MRVERERGGQPHVEQLIIDGQAAQPGQRRHRSRDHGLPGRVVAGYSRFVGVTQKAPGASCGQAEARHSGAGGWERGDGLVAMEHQPGRVLNRECARAGQRGEMTKAVAEKDGRPRLAALDDPVTGQRQRERGHVGLVGAVVGQPRGLTARAAAGGQAGIEAEFRRGHLVNPLEGVGGFFAAQLML
jgi:hypothetical protein